MDNVDVNLGSIFKKLDSWLDGFIAMLPNIGVAVVVVLIFWLIASIVGKVIKRSAAARDRDSLGEVASSLVKWAIIILGIMLAATVVLPSVKPGDLISGLGVSSVAIGFAFKDILQNMLAGILILLRQPFEVGDQIFSGGHEGTVERIETRATFLKTYDGQRVVIPNSDIYTDAVVVITAYDTIRSQADIGVGCSDDWDKAKKLILEAVNECEGVESDPKPEVFASALGDFSNVLRARWWTASDRSTVIHTQGRVLEAVYRKLDTNGIDLPFPTQVVLMHDQTEEVDGDRSKQREGWPAGEDKPPRIARVADREAAASASS